jgi:microcystin-dependent protein
MSDPFIGEIRILPFGYAPRYWAQCNGQTLAINQNAALFSVLGTTYGGDGRTTFKLPNLQGCAPVHFGPNYALGQTGGEANHTLTNAEAPAHTHQLSGTAATGDQNAIGNNVLGATVAGKELYGPADNLLTIIPETVTTAGGGQPHSNMQPYLVLNFCIALSGVYPSQN